MILPDVYIITPTYRRDLKTIERCVACVRSQVYEGNIYHIICSDGDREDSLAAFQDIKKQTGSDNRILRYCWTNEHTNSWGAGVRQHVLRDIPAVEGAYVAHVDDDNIIFPHYVRDQVMALEAHPECGFSICQIIHDGPLPDHLGRPPAIITGIPPRVQNIDTLQVIVRIEAMRTCGWICETGSMGYLNDGRTYEKLGKLFKYVEVPDILGVHL